MDGKKILIVEDDTILGKTLVFNMEEAGFSVDLADGTAQAAEYLKKRIYDMAVLDVNLPDGNGFDLCREWAPVCPNMALVFLTANDLEEDMLKGYELGAADYVTKPFSIRVFERKVDALLKRLGNDNVQSAHRYVDDLLHIDFDSMSARIRQMQTGGECLQGGWKELKLTPMEFRTLWIFVCNPGIVLTRQKLLQKLWDEDENYVDEHALTTMVSRIRSKLDGTHPYIKTVYGMGYLWNARSRQ